MPGALFQPVQVARLGPAGVPVRVRPLGEGAARLRLSKSLAVQAGDRALLRDPGAHSVAAGLLVLDADPPDLRRRGAAALRAAALGEGAETGSVAVEVARRGAVRRADLAALGVPLDDLASVRVEGSWLVDRSTWEGWSTAIVGVVQAHAVAFPLEPGPTQEAARRSVGLPDLALVAPLAVAAGLGLDAGRLRLPGTVRSLGDAEPAVRRLEDRLGAAPFSAPEQPDLDALGLGARELAAAAAAGRLLRLAGGVVLLPDGPARAMRLLAALGQPFTLSVARQALGTTRRVAVPLLELLDARGWTRRIDGALREVVRKPD